MRISIQGAGVAIILDKQAHDSLRKIFQKRLAAARKADKLSHAELDTLCGWPDGLAKRLETGTRPPYTIEAFVLAEALCVPLDWLAGRIDDVTAEPFELHREAIKRGVRVAFERVRDNLADHLIAQASAAAQATQDAQTLADWADEFIAALNRVRELNSETFQDLRGGAKLVSLAKQLPEIIRPLRLVARDARRNRAVAHEQALIPGC